MLADKRNLISLSELYEYQPAKRLLIYCSLRSLDFVENNISIYYCYCKTMLPYNAVAVRLRKRPHNSLFLWERGEWGCGEWQAAKVFHVSLRSIAMSFIIVGIIPNRIIDLVAVINRSIETRRLVAPVEGWQRLMNYGSVICSRVSLLHDPRCN